MTEHKNIYFKFKINGQYIIGRLKDVLSTIETELIEQADELAANPVGIRETLNVKIVPMIMTEKQFDSLPEFGGF